MDMRMPSHFDEYDCYDSTYHPGDYSFYIGDSRMSLKARSSRLHDVVRHTVYHSDAEEDFTKPYRPAAFAEKSKFIASIATTPFPVNAKIPTTVGRYNGAAREWFEKLPDGQISSWEDLVKKFSQQFSQQKKHTRDQFNDESLNIGGISQDMLRGAFRTLTGKDGMPKEWDDLMTAKKLFANTEKTLGNNSSRQKFKVEFQNPRSNKQAKGPIWSRLQPNTEALKPFDARSLIGNKNKIGPSNRGPHKWTPLSKTPAEILTTENVNFRKPQPLIRRSFLDTKKHCSFHKGIGHNTNECNALKREIELAVKSGKLGHLVKDGKPGTGKAPIWDNQGPSKKQVKDFNVHMIQGERKVREKRREYEEEEWKNEPVIFPRIKGGPNNKNPLIITAVFSHYSSQYVLFDTGRFGGEIMHPRGVISFPVTLGDGVCSTTEEVEFLVLPAMSKHDIILGRDAIGDFNAHPSTAHGAVGVPTRTGVAIIDVNRHCLATESLKPSKIPK
ncbi:uncharacterized protein LOC143588387 [Bidens hawaiensis]|uniref:uncharacterized protein LOC143588387 n=1 Tax=Bidens hawaiensis TaxID=980011 RepID=UPI00404B117A